LIDFLENKASIDLTEVNPKTSRRGCCDFMKIFSTQIQ
jgi:hypothetical protein